MIYYLIILRQLRRRVTINFIFIDVDGVLNPWKPTEAFTRYHIEVQGVVYPVYLNPEHGEWLKKLAADTNSELVWGTTWQELANPEISTRIGLPELPHLPLHRGKLSESLGQTKAEAAKRYAGDSKFVYFDDETDLGWYLGDCNGIHFCIDYRYGLLPEHITKASNYLNNKVTMTCVVCNKNDGTHEDYCTPVQVR